MVVAIANINIPFTKMNELNSTAERKKLIGFKKNKIQQHHLQKIHLKHEGTLTYNQVPTRTFAWKKNYKKITGVVAKIKQPLGVSLKCHGIFL